MTGFVTYLTYCSFGIQLLFGPLDQFTAPQGFLGRVQQNWTPGDGHDPHIVYWPSREYDKIMALQHSGGCLASY